MAGSTPDGLEPQVGQQNPKFEGDLVNTFVINLFIKRRDYGVKKYGHELTVDNGRDMEWDKIEELADELVYAVGAWMRRKKHKVAALDALEVARRAVLLGQSPVQVAAMLEAAAAEVGVL